jgi:hypothetical protein
MTNNGNGGTMAENSFRAWLGGHKGLTEHDERNDETFLERVAICLEDGDRSVEECVEIARAERRNRLRLGESRGQR